MKYSKHTLLVGDDGRPLHRELHLELGSIAALHGMQWHTCCGSDEVVQ